jgi:fumarate hydratase class II
VVDTTAIENHLARDPMLITALNREVGYSKAAEIAKHAYQDNRTILEIAVEMTDLGVDRLPQLLGANNLV